MKKPFCLILFCLISFHSATLRAQKAPIAWGEIPPEHLAMDHYAPDSNAAAVILADYGNVRFDDDGKMIFERHTRVKILSTVFEPEQYAALRSFYDQVVAVGAEQVVLKRSSETPAKSGGNQ